MPEQEEALSRRESTPTSRPSGGYASAKESTLSEGPSQPISSLQSIPELNSPSSYRVHKS